ncbi:MAG: hypothetical protein FJ096_02495 [Deltaproteobacteria bacterium]|nr:hypothetical protein [Deltaproteobacteria bacterium]
MPAGTVTLTVIGPGSTPAGPTYEEQQGTAAGNSFDNSDPVALVVRNTNASARIVTFVADRYGVERTVLTATIPGSATENGTAVLGPFPSELFNDHSTTDATKQGHVMFTHNGINTDLKFCPVRLNRGFMR